MICKWCGAKIREKDRTCPRCGQEIPPLSECGGFYDLVPGARQGAVPPVKPVSPMQPTDGPTGYYPPRKKKKNYNTLWLCVWAVLLFAVLALSVKSCSLSYELDRLDDRLSKVEKEQKDMGDGEATAGDGDHNENDPIRLTLNVTNNENDKGELEIDDCPEWTINYTTDENGHYELFYNDNLIFKLRCTLDSDTHWKIETTLSTQTFQWQKQGSKSNPGWDDISDGTNNTCPITHDDNHKVRCILTWKQDDQEYEVTINFPSD